MSDEGGLQRQFFEMLMDSQWWSAEQLRNYQRSQLSQLLRHAKKNVPFYEHRLDAVVKPNGDIDWDRWGEIAIAKRSDLAELGDSMLARELPPGHSEIVTSETSGTSGRPVVVTSTRVAEVALNANRLRSYNWHGVDYARVCCSILGESPQWAWPHGKKLGPWGPEWDPATADGQFIRINRLATTPQLLDYFRRERPAYLTTGPSSAFALALELEALGERWNFDGFLPHGASVEPEARAAIQRVLGAKTIDLYSSKEAGPIAHACPAGEGLHVNAESVFVEIVDDEGRPVPPGRMGQLIVTPLFNAAQPLIRYDQGDVGTLMESCACGRQLPKLGNLIGRSIALFFHPDGRIRTSYLGHHRHLLNCQAWQIAQVGPTRFEVRYVPSDRGLPGDEQALAARLRESYFEDAQVVFVRVPALPVGSSGKPIEYVNEWRSLP